MNFNALREILPVVSRETFDALDELRRLIEKWNESINLVSSATMSNIWNRHIIDSLQLVTHIPDKSGTLLDLGTGGGFPGLVLAIAFENSGAHTKVTMVDSDIRKCEFLRTASRHLGLGSSVVCARFEDLHPFKADVITSRATAPLIELLSFSNRHLKHPGMAIFLKGSRVLDELNIAATKWKFHAEVFPSITFESGRVVRLKDIAHV